tara:strand:+ start:43 stop:885 length:843 start_codon:yes stop_codon:yes gene_type:complete
MIDINRVYQKVLLLINKEQRGYITPQEFNLLADAAQKEIYENYFYQAKNSNAKIKDDDDYTDTLEIIEQKLDTFYTQGLLVANEDSNADNTFNLYNFNQSDNLNEDQDIYKLITIKVKYTDDSNYYLAERVNRKELDLINGTGSFSPNVLNPTRTRPIYTIKQKNRTNNVNFGNPAQTVSPLESNPSFDVVFSTGSASLLVQQVIFTYYRIPVTPNWAYVIVNGKPLYNRNNSVNFELDISEEGTLVSKILLLAGWPIKQADTSQGAISLLQLKNQEQNS